MSILPGSWLLCWRAGLRPLILNARNSFLGIASIALGVAVFLAITIANRSAVESFQDAVAQITGRADLEIRGDFPETLFPLVLRCEGIAAATPLIEAMVTLPAFPGESLHLVGLDPLGADGVLTMQPSLGTPGQGDWAEWLGSKEIIAVSPEFLTRHHLKMGDTIRLQGPGVPRDVKIGFQFAEDPGTSAAQGRVAAIDIAAAQEWVGSPGRLTAILVRVKNPAENEAVIARLKKLLPASVTVTPPVQRTKEVEIMLSAFRMNLTALSLVSLMVGMFFVASTVAADVIRNRVSLGILRTVGAGQGMILGMVLAAAAFCGLVGSALGLLVSPLLAEVLADPVARTVTALYLPVEVQGGWPRCSEALLGVITGVAAATIAAWIPARQAARVDPAQVLHPGAAPEIFAMPAGRLAMTGGVLLAGAAIFSLGALITGPPQFGFGAAFLVLAGFSMMIPGATLILARLLRNLTRRNHLPGGPITRLAVELSRRSLHRTAPTIAALAAAVAMMVGITVMIHSFRESVIAWSTRTLTADLFIAPAANELLGLAHTLPPGAADWWTSRPGVKAVGTFREFEVRTLKGESVTLGVISGPARGRIDFLHGDGEEKTAALFQGEGVALSESLARRLNLGQGETLKVATPQGFSSFRVIDLYRDYTHDRGVAMMGAALFRRFWGEQGIHSLAIEFVPGTPSRLMEGDLTAFTKTFGGREAFASYSNHTLRARIVEIFNQTFAVTAVLRTISIAVAIGGVFLTLGILVMERARDIGVLRSMGASSRQIVQMVLAEATMIGVTASIVGLFSGATLALVLTWVINKAFFGWSIDLAFPWGELLAVPCWMTGTAILAGLLPALHAASLPPAPTLRME